MATPPVVPGFRWAGLEAGIRKRPGRPDLALLVADGPVTAAALFTTNQVAAAPVLVSRPVAAKGNVRAVLMNAGCANACTGEQGLDAARRMAAAIPGFSADHVLVASTGVIGAHLPVAKIEAKTAELLASATPDGIDRFSAAIMTTDTRPKVASRTGTVGGKTVTVAGTCKGAGMIMPDMATMLAVLATDAAVTQSALQKILKDAADDSFNVVTVDGDTSTNDTLYALASGKAGNTPVTEESADFRALFTLFFDTALDLAKQIAADGEGATKFVEVKVEGAHTREEAGQIARTIANSPLVKTAWHAADANWGRIVAAAGRAGFTLDQRKLDLFVDDAPLAKDGVGLGAAAEEVAQERMRKGSFVVRLVLKDRGQASRSVYTCDFSADYVKINAEYRT